MITLLFFVNAFVSNAWAAHMKPYVVYGADSRHEVYEITDPTIRTISDSVGAMIDASNLGYDDYDSSFLFASRPLALETNFCADERFIDQNALAECTVFLVAPDKVASAGHCFTEAADCENKRIVFGFTLLGPDTEVSAVSADNVYACKQIVVTSGGDGQGPDFSIVQLDRPVRDRRPLRLNLSGGISEGTDLYVLGHPTGLPQKIASGANVRSVGETDFVANLDVYGGNSGSPVFNARTNMVEGILVSGENDFTERDEMGESCTVTNYCADDECMGETSTSVSVMSDYLR